MKIYENPAKWFKETYPERELKSFSVIKGETGIRGYKFHYSVHTL